MVVIILVDGIILFLHTLPLTKNIANLTNGNQMLGGTICLALCIGIP